jgi:hypothetical protein
VSGWRHRGIPAETNQFGFRGQVIDYTDQDRVVVLLGDSQVAAENMTVERMPERLLEEVLRERGGAVKVFSLGASGYGQDQQLLVLQEYFQQYRADLVVLWQTEDNDVWNNLFPTHWPRNGWAKPTFRLVDGRLVGPSEGMGQALPTSRFRLLSRLPRGWFSGRDEVWEQYLPPVYTPLSHHEGAACRDWQDRYDHNIGLMRLENLQTEKSHLAFGLVPSSARTQHALRLTNRLLVEIATVASNYGARFVVLNARTPEPEPADPACRSDEVVHVLNGRYYKTSRKQWSENLQAMNAGLPFIAVPVTVTDYRVSAEDRHLNDRANAQVMADLASRLDSLLP